MDQIINFRSLYTCLIQHLRTSEYLINHKRSRPSNMLHSAYPGQGAYPFYRICKALSHKSAHVVHVSSVEQLVVGRRAAWCYSCGRRKKHVLPS